ncbi:hypothetical protein [Thermus phage P23-77]|uniref:Uncharacterized protein n=1 Tax=Thermus virus P23-77 TaxID=1714272 RepID=C8CHL2_9VIRU|nr:hypothetical protein P23-77_gp16 [Thermus phage P23-77]ACV05041.1 hypothetical protein [Thermus phage P23-77]
MGVSTMRTYDAYLRAAPQFRGAPTHGPYGSELIWAAPSFQHGPQRRADGGSGESGGAGDAQTGHHL